MKSGAYRSILKGFILFIIMETAIISCSLDQSPERPAPVTKEANSAFYVNSIIGADNNSGSRTHPWRTIQMAAKSAASGDTVIIQAGVYAEFISIDKSNTAFVAEGKVTMRGFDVSGDNNHISGFTITNPARNFGIKVTGNNNTFEKNDISNTKQDGIWFFGSGNRFSGNNIHDIVDRSKIKTDPHADCFQTWGPAENIVFEKNICDHTSTTGSNQILMLENINPPVKNIIFKNNIFIMHDPGYSPMNFHRQDGQDVISEIYVINNTIVHVNGIGESGIAFLDITGAYAINNLFIDYGNTNHPYVQVEKGADIHISNNAIYKTDNAVPQGIIFSSDIWAQNPGLVDYKNYDFRLQATSRLIDRGQDVGNLVVDDFDGTPRPQGNAWDIGAFEYMKK